MNGRGLGALLVAVCAAVLSPAGGSAAASDAVVLTRALQGADSAATSAANAGAAAAATQEPAVRRQTELDREVRRISAGIRCVVCRGQSIQESNAQLAQEMRGVIRQQLEAGRTPDEVRAYFLERYGDDILLLPPARGFNLVVYFLPIVLIAGGAVFIIVKSRRLAAAGPDTGFTTRPPSDRDPRS